MELISVLMPTYNRAHMIGKAIKSILEQTYSNLQIVIVDDGSTDNTKVVVEQFKDSRIDFYKISHVGISKALNYGLSKTESNIIVRLDSDDYCDKERINIQYSFYNNNDGKYGIIGSNFYVTVADENNTNVLKVVYPRSHKQILNQLPRKCCLAHPTLLFRKDVILEVGGYSEIKQTVEDWDLYLRLLDKTKFYNIQKFLVTHRKHGGNIFSSDELFKKENFEVPFRFFVKIIQSEKDNKKLAKAFFDMGYVYYYQNELNKSLEFFEEAVRLEPFKLQYLRYLMPNKFFPHLIEYSRRHNYHRYLNFFRRLDKNNYFFRNTF